MILYIVPIDMQLQSEQSLFCSSVQRNSTQRLMIIHRATTYGINDGFQYVRP